MTDVRFNCVLTRFQQGYTYVDRANGAARREVFISMPGVKYEQNAREISANLLFWTNQVYQTTLDEGIALDDDQIPQVEWTLNKKIDDDWVMGFSASQTEDGYASIVQELKDNAVVNIERIMRRLDRLSLGVESEWGLPNTQNEGSGSDGDTTPPEFSVGGVLVPAVSPIWIAPRGYWCSWIEASLVGPGSTATRVSVARANPSASGDEYAFSSTRVQSLVIPAGATKQINYVNAGWSAGEGLIMLVPSPGTGATDLAVALRGAMI